MQEETSSPSAAAGEVISPDDAQSQRSSSSAGLEAPPRAGGAGTHDMNEEPSAESASSATAPSHEGLPGAATGNAGTAGTSAGQGGGPDGVLEQFHVLAMEVPGILALADFARKNLSASDRDYFESLDPETMHDLLRKAGGTLSSLLAAPTSLGGGAGTGTATLAGACGGEFLQGAAMSLLGLARDALREGGVGLIPGLSRLLIDNLPRTGVGFGTESADSMDGDNDGMDLPPLEVDVDAAKEARAARRAVTAEAFAAEASTRALVKSLQHARLLDGLGIGHLCDDCGRLPPCIVCLCTASYSRRCPICDFEVHFFRGGGRLCQRSCGLSLIEGAVTGFGNSVLLPLKSNEQCCLYNPLLQSTPQEILVLSDNFPGHSAGQHTSSADFLVQVSVHWRFFYPLSSRIPLTPCLLSFFFHI